MPERSQDWLKQAKRDLESARSQHANGFHEWACFIAQQAAEKGVKAVYQRLGGDAWGHSVYELLRGLAGRFEVPGEFLERARRLDRLYIPARYPNGWSEGTPSELITSEDGADAIGDSTAIVRFCEDVLAGR